MVLTSSHSGMLDEERLMAFVMGLMKIVDYLVDDMRGMLV